MEGTDRQNANYAEYAKYAKYAKDRRASTTLLSQARLPGSREREPHRNADHNATKRDELATETRTTQRRGKARGSRLPFPVPRGRDLGFVSVPSVAPW